MARLRYNGLRASLGASLTNSGTTITFAAALTSLGVNVSTIASPDYIPLCIVSPTTGLVTEIVYLTAYTSGATTGTITRGQEGTTGIAHNSGEAVVQDITAADFGVSTAWTPAWSQSPSGTPTLGTGGTAVGFYSLHGPMCHFSAVITLGTSPGTGTAGNQYSLSLPPVAPTRDGVIAISLRFGGNPYPAIADYAAAATVLAPKVLPTTAGGATLNWTPATPTTPVAGAIYRYSGQYFWTS